MKNNVWKQGNQCFWVFLYFLSIPFGTKPTHFESRFNSHRLSNEYVIHLSIHFFYTYPGSGHHGRKLNKLFRTSLPSHISQLILKVFQGQMRSIILPANSGSTTAGHARNKRKASRNKVDNRELRMQVENKQKKLVKRMSQVFFLRIQF